MGDAPNALRRAALGSEASDDESERSAPPAYPTPRSSLRSLRRRSSTSLVVSSVPTIPLALHVQSASMLMSEEPADFATPENSECSESSAAGGNRFKRRGGRQLAADSSSSSSSDRNSDTSSPSPPLRSTGPSRWTRPLCTIPEDRELDTPSMLAVVPTYTKLVYNPDPLGKAPWQTFLIPDSVISSTLRSYLAAASMSDELDPLRVCECRAGCTEHTAPDMVAKLVPCYLLDLCVASIYQTDVKCAIAEHKRRGTLTLPGLWQRYSVRPRAANSQHISNVYKFKMFCV